MENIELTPRDYFEDIKNKKQKNTNENLDIVYENSLILLNKYIVTGQKKGAKKLMFLLECIEKERNVIELGIDTFVYKEDIEKYIDDISKNTVKIIELENYEREIPDEIVEIIEKTKDIFDKMYVLFTDYTGKITKEISKERRDKDPILFGVFSDEKSRAIVDRFYYLGDWEDEYCDLTLEKMINDYKKKGRQDILKHIITPKSLDELKKELDSLEKNNDTYKQLANIKPLPTTKNSSVEPPKLNIFKKIKNRVFKNEK
ncbi:hypothetical protein QCK_4201 [Clostridioides difficile CD45]|uniref:hypothetical protein n=2 Tax=Clostridioides difficile TaxID=1496 RepID=UPI00038D385B|nr:hypothetical protein [Clostridioides difficile]OFU06782.1 hypothetical protein HMPREF3083_06505 [Clostridium sp. HMSC19D07]EGT4203162.1 hypothetical protein [Clostridioides difficile]EGT5282764.1 hypothetical protein [Clostridioides difficile]EQE71192.1 hypothetical protein QCK_4201 [Clostridioides difficile CD45]MBG0082128.1 hypothetical protein [Clostridioides difficile]